MKYRSLDPHEVVGFVRATKSKPGRRWSFPAFSSPFVLSSFFFFFFFAYLSSFSPRHDVATWRSIRLLCQLKIFLSAILRENRSHERGERSRARPWDSRILLVSMPPWNYRRRRRGNSALHSCSLVAPRSNSAGSSRTFVLVNSSPGFRRSSAFASQVRPVAWKNACGRFRRLWRTRSVTLPGLARGIMV